MLQIPNKVTRFRAQDDYLLEMNSDEELSYSWSFEGSFPPSESCCLSVLEQKLSSTQLMRVYHIMYHKPHK